MNRFHMVLHLLILLRKLGVKREDSIINGVVNSVLILSFIARMINIEKKTS